MHVKWTCLTYLIFNINKPDLEANFCPILLFDMLENKKCVSLKQYSMAPTSAFLHTYSR